MTELSDTPVEENRNGQGEVQTESDVQVWRPIDSRLTDAAWQEHLAQAKLVRRFHLMKTTQLIWLATTMLELLFAMRFVLKLMDANPAAGFAIFIYNISALFLAPFLGLTAMPSSGGAILEVPTAIAMVVYAVWAWLIVRILWALLDDTAPTASVVVRPVRRDEPDDSAAGGYR